MPATQFICPDGTTIPITTCLKQCPNSQRCMFLPTLKAVAKSLTRDLDKPSVTELLSGNREIYLKKTTDYAVDPQKQLYALHGSAVHTINEQHIDGNMLSEERFFDDITSGKLDLYGQILNDEIAVLGDIKITNSYKLMNALGIYKEDVLTGEIYKSGTKQGQEKTRKEFRYDGVRRLMDWALQINYYRILLEKHGLKVKKMVIQTLCRDVNTRIARERGITKPVYLIPVHKLSDLWVTRYMRHKAKVLRQALESNTLPPPCRPKENWNGRKCLEYCVVAGNCPYAQQLREATSKKAA